VAIYQTMFALPLLLPSAPLSNLAITNIPSNLWNGLMCFGGHDSVVTGDHPDSCGLAAVYMLLFLLFNIAYNMLLIIILKHGGTTVLYLSSTCLIPLSNFVFALDFMPQHRSLGWSDIVGLVVIMSGLFIYRFLNKIWVKYVLKENLDAKLDVVVKSDPTESAVPLADMEEGSGDGDATRSWLQPRKASQQQNRYVNLPTLFVPSDQGSAGGAAAGGGASGAALLKSSMEDSGTPRVMLMGTSPGGSVFSPSNTARWSINQQGTIVKRRNALWLAAKTIVDFPDDL